MPFVLTINRTYVLERGDIMNLAWIDEYVFGVIDYCHSNDIFEIYKTLDININRLDKDDYLLQGYEALYVRNYFGIEVVFIRDDLPYLYEKFILAHELGHAILHIEMIQATFKKSLTNKGKLEKQADYFACNLLNIKLDDVYHYQLSKSQIAKDLGVSEGSLEYIYMNSFKKEGF